MFNSDISGSWNHRSSCKAIAAQGEQTQQGSKSQIGLTKSFLLGKMIQLLIWRCIYFISGVWGKLSVTDPTRLIGIGCYMLSLNEYPLLDFGRI